MTEQRIKELECTLRKLRQNIFNYTGESEIKADRLLLHIKQRLAPEWNKRAACIESPYARVMWM